MLEKFLALECCVYQDVESTIYLDLGDMGDWGHEVLGAQGSWNWGYHLNSWRALLVISERHFCKVLMSAVTYCKEMFY